MEDKTLIASAGRIHRSRFIDNTSDERPRELPLACHVKDIQDLRHQCSMSNTSEGLSIP